MDLNRISLVAAGTFVGSLLRWAVEWSVVAAHWPRGTAIWIVNLCGAAIIGYLVGREVPTRPSLVTFLAPGVLAGFTTYSALIGFTGLTDWAAMPTLGVLACFAGLRLGRRRHRALTQRAAVEPS